MLGECIQLRWLVLAVVVGLSACVTPPALPPAPPAPPVVVDRDAEARQREAAQRQQQRQIAAWLVNARQALANDRLMIPLSDNAYSWYQQVLAVDELNAEAHRGMQQITARYLQLAEQAFDSGQFASAERMLRGAERIAATPAQTEALRKRYRQRAAANATVLPPGELSARSERVQAQLAELAVTAREANSRLLIVARSDAEGRWIYQRMRAAVPGFRLRGNIDIGSVPRVILIDL